MPPDCTRGAHPQETAPETAGAAPAIIKELLAVGKKLAAAESCTAGLVSDMIASVPGASAAFWGAFVTYTPDAKTKLLGVPEETIKRYGAVSEETARAMAEGALKQSGCDFSVAVTGLAGPGGDGTDTPLGTVWTAFAGRAGETATSLFRFEGSRSAVRNLAAKKALDGLLSYIRAGAVSNHQF